MTNKEINTIKLQQKKLEMLLEDLNNLSIHRYSYKFGQQEGQNKHYLYVTINRHRILFRYYDNIIDVIQLVQNLIKYRTMEYETGEEYDD